MANQNIQILASHLLFFLNKKSHFLLTMIASYSNIYFHSALSSSIIRPQADTLYLKILLK